MGRRPARDRSRPRRQSQEGSYLEAQYRRLAARRGKKKAALAVGHSILVIAYALLSHPERTFQDLGGDYFDQRDRQGLEQRLIHRLQAWAIRSS